MRRPTRQADRFFEGITPSDTLTSNRLRREWYDVQPDPGGRLVGRP
ncbi:MAG TPA: hypothetical protein VLB67_15460 [Acidimicrobiia bacterium]|nr:hypothetical protein [Acidimicrobiia bacterium]